MGPNRHRKHHRARRPRVCSSRQVLRAEDVVAPAKLAGGVPRGGPIKINASRKKKTVIQGLREQLI